MVEWQGDVPAKKSDDETARGCAGEKWAMGCASLDRQRWRSEGMQRPKMGNGGPARGCANQMEQHQIGRLAANVPANEETESAGNAPAK